MSIDIGSAASRIYEGLQVDFQSVCFDTSKELAPLVESEIELMVLATFKVCSRISTLKIQIGEEFEAGEDRFQLLITPQFKWNGYRIDFCVRTRRHPDKMVFVECDGHDFHERTKEQAERDRSKDRAIQAAGIPILRFTGREIWRNPVTVCCEIFEFVAEVDR